MFSNRCVYVFTGTEALSENIEEDENNDKKKLDDGWESCSEDEGNDDDSDNDWVDVHHSSDEEVRGKACLFH